MQLIKAFKLVIFDPNLCDTRARSLKCSLVQEYGSNACKSCRGAYKVVKCYRKTKKWFMFDKGNKVVVDEFIHKFKKLGLKVKDKSSFPILSELQQFNVKTSLLEEPRKSSQLSVIDTWVREKYGQIVCPPRSGKTLLGAMLASRSKTRTAIIIHQKELLDQFYSTFIKFTNIQEKIKLNNCNLIKINPRPEEVDSLSIVLYTWQQFISKRGKERLREVRDKFGLIIIDESHRMSSDIYSDVVSRFKARYRCGLTATPKRKDKLHFRQDNIIGPVVVEGGTEQLSCNYSIVDTQWQMPEYKEMNNQAWNYLWGRIAKEPKRNELIAGYVKYDLEHNHKIIIPVKRIEHAKQIANLVKDITKNFIVYISSVSNREKVSQNIRDGKYDVVIATKQMISLGFDAPPMSCLYFVVPSFDKNNFYQEYSRIRTQYKNKPTPLIRLFIDDGKISESFKFIALKDFMSRGFKEIEK